jgi:predicted Zn-dependent peptidase
MAAEAAGVPSLPVEQATLANGLRVVVSADWASPVVVVHVWYDVGSRHERPGQTGLAHLFEHLMFEGSAHVASGEHFQLIQQAGGFNNATTSFDRTNYFQCVTAENLDLVLWLEADRMGSLLDAVTQESLDKQRSIVKNERRQRYDNVPYGTASERLQASLYPAGHPYHHVPIGSMEDLEAASLDDVHAFFHQHYSPDNAVLTVVGAVDPAFVFERVAHYFDGIPARPPLSPRAPAGDGLGPVAAPPPVEYTQAAIPEQAVVVGYALPPETDPSMPALEVGFAVLSSGRGSAFHQRVVRAELATQCNANLRSGAGASTAVLMVLGKGGSSPDAARVVMDAEVRRLAEEGPTDDELRRAKALRRRSWLSRLADPSARADELSHCAVAFGDPRHAAARLADEMAVDPDDVRQAFAATVGTAQPAVLTYRPAAAAGSR